MSSYVTISKDEMHDFLTNLGFQSVDVDGTSELVYGKRVDRREGYPLTIRIYTSIDGTKSRGKGDDAIRVGLFWYDKKYDRIESLGFLSRVHRMKNWKKHLGSRIENWKELIGSVCGNCGAPMVLREGSKGKFYGCARFGYTECSCTKDFNS